MQAPKSIQKVEAWVSKLASIMADPLAVLHERESRMIKHRVYKVAAVPLHLLACLVCCPFNCAEPWAGASLSSKYVKKCLKKETERAELAEYPLRSCDLGFYATGAINTMILALDRLEAALAVKTMEMRHYSLAEAVGPALSVTVSIPRIVLENVRAKRAELYRELDRRSTRNPCYQGFY
jgi:hypothetical protein